MPSSADVEGRSATTTNPYQQQEEPTPPPLLYYIMDKLKRLLYLSLSAAALHKFFNFFRVLLKSPHIVHAWFQIGLACTVGELCVVCVSCVRENECIE